jgi:hypothetical protein
VVVLNTKKNPPCNRRGSSISCHLIGVRDDRGAQHTCIVLDTWGGVSLQSPLSPAHILHPPRKQLLMVVVWGAGPSWSLSLIPSSLMHLYLSHSTPFHPTSNCLWQHLGVLCGVGSIVSHPPSSLSTHLPLVSPTLVLYGGGSPSLVPLSSHVSLTAVLGSCWYCVGFGSIVVFLLICREGVIVSVVPVMIEQC